MKKIQVKLNSKNGLHARPARELIDQLSKYESTIYFEKEIGNKVNAKSLTSLLLLGLEYGDFFKVYAEGADEVKAVIEIKELVEKRLCD